ncbi:MAG: 1-acyl-sn-glycerol-3-phosphate acyltransferase [Planctomycetales bacterium]|nr:1-acyl-sn-glycerol-3-phosphate acyltransferase [Planctomycetales bacterium]
MSVEATDDRQQRVSRRDSAASTAVRRPWLQRATYAFSRWAARLVGVALCRLRCEGREHLPESGPVLVCANHQSYLDPIIVGLACDRRLNYLARQNLFNNRVFGWLIRWYDAIPIERDGMGLSGMKETLRRLKRGEMVLIFPEGTRCSDGKLGPLKPGFCALARRSGAPLLPIAFEGAFEIWPRYRHWPRPAPLAIQFGAPLWPDEIATLDDESLLSELQTRLADCQQRAHDLNRPRRVSAD